MLKEIKLIANDMDTSKILIDVTVFFFIHGIMSRPKDINVCKNFIVPIAFIIGIIIYFKKSKTSTEKKIIIALIIGILGWILWSILNYTNVWKEK